MRTSARAVDDVQQAANALCRRIRAARRRQRQQRRSSITTQRKRSVNPRFLILILHLSSLAGVEKIDHDDTLTPTGEPTPLGSVQVSLPKPSERMLTHAAVSTSTTIGGRSIWPLIVMVWPPDVSLRKSTTQEALRTCKRGRTAHQPTVLKPSPPSVQPEIALIDGVAGML